MSFNFTDLNFFAIGLSILSNMVLGMLWYSPILFGKIWLKLVDLKSSDISKDESNKYMSLALIPAILFMFSLAIILKLLNCGTVFDGFIIASILSIGFIGTSSFNLVLFENRKVKLTLIHVGYAFVSLNIASIILVIWQ